MSTHFGRALRRWRSTRGVSQHELALRAQVAPRHLSFVETGRSRPGESVVLRLAHALELGPRDTNALLEAAGLSPLFPGPATDASQFGPYRRVIDAMLSAHEPFPCLVIDRSWNLLEVNAPARRLFGVEGALPAAEVVRRMYGPGPLRDSMLNWPAVAWAGADRLRAEARAAADPPEMLALLRQIEGYLDGTPRPRLVACEQGFAICPVFSFDGHEVRTLSTLTRFVGALDVDLDEVRIEHIFPADPASEAFMRAMAAA